MHAHDLAVDDTDMSSPSPGGATTRPRARKLAAVACMTVAIFACTAGAASADPWGADHSPSSYGNAGWGNSCWHMQY
jgi:hypothetical protein